MLKAYTCDSCDRSLMERNIIKKVF